MKRLFIAIALVIIFQSKVFAGGPDSAPCFSFEKEIALDNVVATAATWDNLRKNEGSIAFESRRLLGAVWEDLKPPTDFCPNYCQLKSSPEVIFKSVPNKFISDYSDRDKCENLFEQTKKEPFVYKRRSFATLEEFHEWFSDFSQGKGRDGNDLYDKCDGRCSPRYKTFISKEKKSYLVDAEVQCGPARDKSDNKYQLSSSLLWNCVSK